MKKIYNLFLGAFLWYLCPLSAFAVDKFDVLPDLPEPLATAQAASVTTTVQTDAPLVTHTIGQEPNILSVVFSLIFVVLLIYATGIIYTKLNKMGISTFKKQMGENQQSKVSVVSTTPLGGNKTLHIVELDGKRMLIGASSTSIQLLKDLGTFPPEKFEAGEYSKIEIPDIRIPKIEIPKIEFPNIGFTRAFVKSKDEEQNTDNEEITEENDVEISEIYEEESSDGIIDKLFQKTPEASEPEPSAEESAEHKVDPDEYALYKKYL